MLELGKRLGVVLDSEVGHTLAVAAQVGDERVVRVQDERARRVLPPAGPPSGRRASRARRIGRAGRGTGWRAGAVVAGGRGRLRAARPRRPRTARSAHVRRPRRAAPWPLPRTCSSPPGCAPPGGRRAREQRRSSRLSWSCRWWRRPARIPRRDRRPSGAARAATGPAAGARAPSFRRCGPAYGSRPAGGGRGRVPEPCIRSWPAGRSPAGSAAPRSRSPGWSRSGRRRRRSRMGDPSSARSRGRGARAHAASRGGCP